MSNNIPKIRTIKEAAKETGLSYHCLRTMCLDNKIVYFRAGTKFMINLDKLIEYLNTGITVAG